MKSALLCLAIIYAVAALGVLLMVLDRRNFEETEDDMSPAELAALAAALIEAGETLPACIAPAVRG